MITRKRSRSALLLLLVVLGCGPGDDDAGPYASDPGAAGKADGERFIVNGYALTTREQQWMQYVADRVVLELPGDPERQLEIASRAAWWSLKEGTFDVRNAPKYSNCNFESGDRLIGALDTCTPRRAWQVGLAAVQVPGHSVSALETLAGEVFPDATVDQVLADAAAEAGYAPDGATSNAIVDSQGSLRASWLLRNSVLGFTVVERDEVVPECIDGSRSWCYGRGWDTTRWYAPTRSAALRAIDDIELLLQALVQGGPAPVPPWVGSVCQADGDCAFSASGAQGFCHLFTADGVPAGFCSLACEGTCPDRADRGTTFCVADVTRGGGLCAQKAGATNHDCADIPGTRALRRDRYIGESSASAKTAVVCVDPD